MSRSLAAILALSVISCAVPSSSRAASPPLSAKAGEWGVFRLHGGTVHPDRGGGAGPGWLAGGAVGFGLSRDFLLLFGYDHIAVDRRGMPKQGIGAMTVQFELGKPFQGVVTSRVNVGAGVYLRTVRESYYTNPYYPYGYPNWRTDAPFGMNMGGGLSFRMSRRVMFDVDAHYHQTMATTTPTLVTTVTAGLTFALTKKEARPEDGYVMASR